MRCSVTVYLWGGEWCILVDMLAHVVPQRAYMSVSVGGAGVHLRSRGIRLLFVSGRKSSGPTEHFHNQELFPRRPRNRKKDTGDV